MIKMQIAMNRIKFWKKFLPKINRFSRSKLCIYWKFTRMKKSVMGLWICHGQQGPSCLSWRFTVFPYSCFWMHLNLPLSSYVFPSVPQTSGGYISYVVSHRCSSFPDEFCDIRIATKIEISFSIFLLLLQHSLNRQDSDGFRLC